MHVVGPLGESATKYPKSMGQADARGTPVSVLPGCHFGRLGFYHGEGCHKSDNEFAKKSCLATKRRPNAVFQLPALSEMISAESINPDLDVTSRDRTLATPVSVFVEDR